MNSTIKINLKGSKFCGEAYPQNREGGLLGGIYRLADGTFALVKREEYSGRILSAELTPQTAWRRFKTLRLSASTSVQMYCPREATN